ncbi:MAG: hypothetical protein IPH93_05845 [Saprospiraceae bacterium]|nr:hypothetical protein [Saprospiraceae bacterium]
MKILKILLVLTIAKCTGLAQDRTFFNLLPDIGAVKGQCVFGSIECDSQYIYIVGDEVVSQDSNGRNKKVKPHLTKFDYQGNLIHSKLITEDDFQDLLLDKITPSLEEMIQFTITTWTIGMIQHRGLLKTILLQLI